MDAFSAPTDEKFAGLVAADVTEAVPLPVGEAPENPLTPDELREAQERETRAHAPIQPDSGPAPVPPPADPAPDSPLSSGAGRRSPLTDRDLLSRVQRDQVGIEHKLVHIENELLAARRANQIVMLTIGVACALLIITMYRRRTSGKE